jgi:branched-chain amino acid transport system permease protein
VGGIGTFEGPILGAVIFFLVETFFGAAGVAYLIGLGVTAVLFALLLPRGLWGWVEQRFGVRVLPVGYRLVIERTDDGPGMRSAAGRAQA